ncbi:hypothetical protein, partial [Candidatus Propionivibrio aalborgensis]|uniref:hypothetical protein n=1 Tax=Candidatus Propionivibrio aalborgensis TaxID=1860101 RepID=UPI001C919B3C
DTSVVLIAASPRWAVVRLNTPPRQKGHEQSSVTGKIAPFLAAEGADALKFPRPPVNQNCTSDSNSRIRYRSAADDITLFRKYDA